MAAPSAAALIAAWEPSSRAPPHRRLGTLLAACEGAEAIAGDTLGGRNRRLLALHRALVGAPLEAQVTCAHCGAQSEFALPVDAILAAPPPDPDARVRLRCGRRTLTFRLPRMADIEAARDAAAGRQAAAGREDDITHAVLERCRVGAGDIPETAATKLAAKFEALDPAADVVVNIGCADCARPISASVDVASFIARELDRLVDGLFRDVDTIASAYGWSEPAILALPPARRRRYVALIAAARAAARPRLAGRSA
jgi:hypothetical protein